MRIHFLFFACVAALAQKPAPKAAPRPSQAKAAAVSSTNDIDAVIELVKSGTPENLVVKTIQKSGKNSRLPRPTCCACVKPESATRSSRR